MFLSYLVAVYAVLVTKSTAFDQCEGDYCPFFLTAPEPLFGAPSDAETIFLGQDQKTGCLCRYLPGHSTACFGRNSCRSLPIHLNITSPMLRITETLVDTLKLGDFQNVQHLLELQLEGNSKLENILPGTFENMSNVLNLSISYNANLNGLHKDCFKGLVNLKHLYLNKNGFQSLTQITPSLKVNTLPSLLRLTANLNNFSHVKENDFEPMRGSKLKELSLGICRIEYIDLETLIPLKNLEQLQLPENRISSDNLANLLDETIKAKIDLRMLNLFWINTSNVIPKKLLKVVAKSNVTVLKLAKNHFEEFTKDSFPYMPKIEVLDLRNVLLLTVDDQAFRNLPNLKILLLSSNRLVNVPTGVLLPSLTYLDLQENSEGPLFSSYFMLKNKQFHNMNNLIYLNLAYNTIPHLFNKSFIGLNNLKTLVLKNLSLFHVEKLTFVPLKNLEYLDLDFNAINHGKALPDIFFSLEKLKILKLNACQFRYISTDINPFRNLKLLEKLELGFNFLSTLSPANFKPLISLKYIDIQRNYLTLWNERLFSSNTLLKTIIVDKNKISVLNSAMLQDFLNVKTVNMDFNGFVCACFVASSALMGVKTNVSILKTIFKPNVFCTYPEELSNVTLSLYYEDVQSGKITCKTKQLLTFLPLIIVVIFLLFSLVLGYYFRWQIRYLFFLTKLYLSRKGKIKSKSELEGYDNYIYDAFVSYCSEDTDFVLKLGTVLENFPPYYKLCVYDRDFLGGAYISDAILVSIERSRKTLLIVSDNYAKSNWCRWESRIAEHYRINLGKEDGTHIDDTLILLKIGELNKSHVTPLLRYLLKTRVYLEWTKEEHKQKAFWEKLVNALGPPIINKEVTKL